MDQQLKQELLIELDKSKENLTLVEGIKDKLALESFGFSKIILVKGKPIYVIVENVVKIHKKNNKVNILTDLDKEGRKLYHILKDELCRRGINCNDRLRELLFKTELRQIEGLTKYLNRNKN